LVIVRAPQYASCSREAVVAHGGGLPLGRQALQMAVHAGAWRTPVGAASHGQSFPTLRTTGVQHLSAVPRRHSCAESMRPLPLDALRLICPLHLASFARRGALRQERTRPGSEAEARGGANCRTQRKENKIFSIWRKKSDLLLLLRRVRRCASAVSHSKRETFRTGQGVHFRRENGRFQGKETRSAPARPVLHSCPQDAQVAAHRICSNGPPANSEMGRDKKRNILSRMHSFESWPAVSEFAVQGL